MAEEPNSSNTPKKLPQNPRYVAMETGATILVIIGAILAARHASMAMVAIIFVVAAILFLVSAMMNIQSIKAQQKQMDQLEKSKKDDESGVVETRPRNSK